MNIVVFGAGAIGSLFGAYLSKNNDVTLIGRTDHIQAIRQKGLQITGKTTLSARVAAFDSAESIIVSPDLLIVTVKSYDTEQVMRELKLFLTDETIVLSLQNGLDNLEKIAKVVDQKNILGGVTSHGAVLTKPGVVQHTGKGETILGEGSRKKTRRLIEVVSLFNTCGVETKASSHFEEDLWMKAIINSSINPLTAFFNVKNGYLILNPVLEHVVEQVCRESTMVARSYGLKLSYTDMVRKTKEVIRNTHTNYSSMLQSVNLGKKTEIESINGFIVETGRRNGIPVPLNTLLVHLVHSLKKG